MHLGPRSLLLAAIVFLTVGSHARAQSDVISYPLAPHVSAAEGTIDFWLRLDAEPDAAKGDHFFPVFSIRKADEERVRFSYQTIMRPEFFHFWFASSGMMLGKMTRNPIVSTVDEAQQVTKADRGADRYPRLPRLHKGEWHHVAMCWQGLPQSTVSMYVDGRLVMRPIALQAAIWDDVESFLLTITSYTHATITLDDLRISSVVRGEEEIKQVVAAGTCKADRFTLMLDRFERIETRDDGQTFTVAEVFARGLGQNGGRVVNAKRVELVEGKSGKGLKVR